MFPNWNLSVEVKTCSVWRSEKQTAQAQWKHISLEEL
jgi:hypothetical protein